MSLADRRGLRMFTLCVLYVAQGIPWGFIVFTLAPYLSAQKLDDAAIGGVMAMTTLPYSFKWVWGFVIDAFPIRRFGRRRPWIIFAQLMMTLTIGAMIFVPDLIGTVRFLTWMVFVQTVFNSMQDVAVDALAVDLLDEAERGRANGLMYASKWIGAAIGGTGLAHVIKWAGLRSALIVQTALLAGIMLVPLLVRERALAEEPMRPPFWRALSAWVRRQFAGRPAGRVFGDAVRSRSVQSAVLCAVAMLLSNFASPLLAAIGNRLFTEQLGWDRTDYTSLIGGWGVVAGALGSIVGGFAADRVGHRLLAGAGALALAAYYVSWSQLAPHWTSHALVYSVFWVEPFFMGMMTASLFALCMDVAWPAIAASQFAIYMALSNLASTIAYRHAGDATDRWDYPTIYLVAAAVQASLVLVLPLIDPKAARRPAVAA